jgi:foldase protein PrsA
MATKKRKTVTRKKVSATSPATSAATQRTTVSEDLQTSPSRRRWITIGVVVLILLGLLYYFKSFFIAATVNGQPITRYEIVKELEAQGGKQTLNNLVTEKLIQQEAKKQNVTVDQKEVDNEIKKLDDSLKKQGQSLNDVLTARGLTHDGLEKQIRIQKIIEKLLGKSVTVSDSDVNKYIETNKQMYPDGATAQVKTQVKDQLKQQKLSEKFQTWISDLEKKAKINYFVSY